MDSKPGGQGKWLVCFRPATLRLRRAKRGEWRAGASHLFGKVRQSDYVVHAGARSDTRRTSAAPRGIV